MSLGPFGVVVEKDGGTAGGSAVEEGEGVVIVAAGASCGENPGVASA